MTLPPSPHSSRWADTPDEDGARTVLLVKAVEEADTRHEILPEADRRWATREAQPPEGRPEAGSALTPAEASFLVRRSRALVPVLERRAPALAHARSAMAWRGGVALALAAASFVAGLLSNELGAGREVNILAFPLLGMLAWNVAVYVVLIARAARPAVTSQRTAHGPWTALACRVLLDAGARRREALPAVPATAIATFGIQWSRAASGLNGARVRRVLHVCAALLAAGAVAGLYLRGIAFEYRAVWESTFLDARAVHRVLVIVLGPASALTGIALPDEAALVALRSGAGSAGENAARWIHLYAATALLFIVVPRAVLALTAWHTERRLTRAFPLPPELAPYCRRLLMERHMHERTLAVDVVGVNRTLSPHALDNLLRALQPRLGAQLTASSSTTVGYGDEEAHLDSLGAAAASIAVLVFDLAATPEEENHGLLLHGYGRRANDAHPLVAVLDESAYRRRLAGQAGAAGRIDERRAAWTRLARAHGLELIVLDLEDPTTAAAA